MAYQLCDSVTGFAYSFGGTCIILFIMNLLPGLSLRCSEESEILGIDDAEIGEFAVRAYYSPRGFGMGLRTDNHPVRLCRAYPRGCHRRPRGRIQVFGRGRVAGGWAREGVSATQRLDRTSRTAERLISSLPAIHDLDPHGRRENHNMLEGMLRLFHLPFLFTSDLACGNITCLVPASKRFLICG